MSLKSHGNALPEGYRLLWYRIGRVLGQGGFGITYEAFDTNLETSVAIKEYLPKEFAVREQDSTVRPFTEDRKKMFEWGLERFLQEARTLAKFHHQNIVRVYNVLEENGTAYMVMEFEQGEALDQLFKFGRLESESDLLRITFPLLDGLEHMHQAGFIHRDIKPANIYVRLDGSPVLIDFGSARFAIGGETKTLTSLITPGFAPYEQYHTESGKQGPWTDIYSLGATLYAGINRGRSPLDAILRGNARIEGKPDSMGPAVELGKGKYTSEFLQAIDAALGFTPMERPQTVTEWRLLFPSLDKRPPTPEIKPQSQEDITTFVHKKAQISKGSRYRLVKWLMISLVVTVIASGVYFIETRQPTKSPVPDQLQTIDVQRQQEKQEAEQLAFEAEALHRQQEEQARLAQEAKAKKQQEEQERIDRLKREREQQAEAQRKKEEQAQLAQEAKVKIQREEQEQIDQLKREEERKKQEIEKRDRQINLLLAKGKSAISARRLTKPVGNNALEYFRETLQIDPNNSDARQGIKDIVESYISLAEKALKNNLFDKAEAYLEIAKEIDPASESISVVEQSVQDKRLDYVEAERLRLEKLQKENAAEQLAQTKKKQEIERLLYEAEKDITSGRFTIPPGQNALGRYRLVLELDPSNQAALRGVEEIMQREESQKETRKHLSVEITKDIYDEQPPIALIVYGESSGASAERLSRKLKDNFMRTLNNMAIADEIKLQSFVIDNDYFKGNSAIKISKSMCKNTSVSMIFGMQHYQVFAAPEASLVVTSYDCTSGQYSKRTFGVFYDYVDNSWDYSWRDSIIQFIRDTDVFNNTRKTYKGVVKKSGVEQKTVGLIILASGRSVGYGASGLAGEDVRNNLVNSLDPVIPKDKYSILHSEWVSLGWYIKETRHEGYRALCTKYNANQILLSIIDGEDGEITISFYNCQNQEEIVEKSSSLPSAIDSKLMKFIKKHQLFQ